MANESQRRGPQSFAAFSRAVSQSAGHPAGFVLALLVVLVWAVSGPVFRFSDTWQLVINTGTTIVTFLMVFLIQNTQNRDATAMHLKLDELIRATEGARNAALDMEDLPKRELDRLHEAYEMLAARARESAARQAQTGSPDLDPAGVETRVAVEAEAGAQVTGTRPDEASGGGRAHGVA